MVSNREFIPGLQSFEKDIDYMPGLVMPFDVYFLKGVPKEVFMNEAESLQELLTDEVIENSFNLWPRSIRLLDARDIALKIKARKNDLPEYAARFHTILDEKPKLTIPLKGSEDVEAMLGCFDCE
jgi:hypothetical protein